MTPEERTAWFLDAARLPTKIPAWEHHLHSTFTDGTDTAEALVLLALELGLERVVFTEHTEPDLVMGPGWFPKYVQEIARLRDLYVGRLDVVTGLEVPALDFAGQFLLDEADLESVAFLLGAVHRYPGVTWEEMPDLEPERGIDLEFRATMGLLDNPKIDCIAHPGGMCQHHITPFPMALFEEIVQKAVANHIAVELNPGYQKPTLDPYLEICRRHGAMISPGSNAHKPRDLGLACRTLQGIVDWGAAT
ncbi:MAG: PHP domain-containing protein [Magnetococcales bacterium]|nr:PHP domain-containing protein [Magnetococcales bacterium]